VGWKQRGGKEIYCWISGRLSRTVSVLSEVTVRITMKRWIGFRTLGVWQMACNTSGRLLLGKLGEIISCYKVDSGISEEFGIWAYISFEFLVSSCYNLEIYLAQNSFVRLQNDGEASSEVIHPYFRIFELLERENKLLPIG